MSTIGDGLGLARWITQRVDQVSAWVKKGVRSATVKKIDRSVNAHDGSAVDSIVRGIEKRRKERTNAN